MRGIFLAIVLMVTATCRAEAQSLTDAVFPQANQDDVAGPWVTEVKPIALDDRALTLWTSSVVATAARARKRMDGAPSGLLHTHGSADPILSGMASYYGSGVKTAAGEPFDPSAMTAAHRSLPFGTRVKVTRVDTGDSIVVRINDRGPFKPGRVIDLSQGAATTLGITTAGLASVQLEVLGDAGTLGN